MNDDSQRVDRCDGTECQIGKELINMCKEQDKSSYYVCTLFEGHRGKHVACNLFKHNLAIW